MERKRILKQLYGEPPKFDPAMVEELLRDVELPQTEFTLTESIHVYESGFGYTIRPFIFSDQTLYIQNLYQSQMLLDKYGNELFDAEQISDPVEVNGHIYLSRQREDGRWEVLGPDFEVVKEHNEQIIPHNINGKLYFMQVEPAGSYLTDWTGKKIERFPMPVIPVEMNGKAYFLWDKTEVKQGFEILSSEGKKAFPNLVGEKRLADAGGKTVLAVDFFNRAGIFNEKGERISPWYEEIHELLSADDTLYFSAKELPRQQLLDQNKEVPIPGPGRIISVIQAGDHAQFVKAIETDHGEEEQYIYDFEGNRIAGPFEQFDSAHSVDGMFYYEVRDQGKRILIDETGAPLTDEKLVGEIRVVGDDLFYGTKQDRKIVIHSLRGKEIAFTKFDFRIENIAGTPWFIFGDYQNTYLLNADGSKSWGPYDSLSSCSDREPFFSARLGNDSYILHPDYDEPIARVKYFVEKVEKVGNRIYIFTVDQIFGYENGERVFETDGGKYVVIDEHFYFVEQTDLGEVVKRDDGSVMSEPWGQIAKLLEQDGDLYFMAWDGQKYNQVGPNGVFPRQFNSFDSDEFFKIDGKIFYIASKDVRGKHYDFLSTLDQEEIGGLFDVIDGHKLEEGFVTVMRGAEMSMMDLQGKLLTDFRPGGVRMYKHDQRPYAFWTQPQTAAIVNLDGERFGDNIEARRVRHPVVLQGNLFFVANTGEADILVDEDGAPVEAIEPFHDIIAVKAIEPNKLIVIGYRKSKIIHETFEFK